MAGISSTSRAPSALPAQKIALTGTVPTLTGSLLANAIVGVPGIPGNPSTDNGINFATYTTSTGVSAFTGYTTDTTTANTRTRRPARPPCYSDFRHHGASIFPS